MKYIMFRSDYPVPRLIPFIFPNTLVHEMVATAMREVLVKHNVLDAKVASAGNASGLRALVSGHSETLKVASNEVDQEVINTYDYFHGILDDGEPE